MRNPVEHSPFQKVIVFCWYLRLVRATQSAALAISTTGCGEERTSMTDIFCQIRRGMVLLDTHLGPPKACVRYLLTSNMFGSCVGQISLIIWLILGSKLKSTCYFIPPRLSEDFGPQSTWVMFVKPQVGLQYYDLGSMIY